MKFIIILSLCFLLFNCESTADKAQQKKREDEEKKAINITEDAQAQGYKHYNASLILLGIIQGVAIEADMNVTLLDICLNDTNRLLSEYELALSMENSTSAIQKSRGIAIMAEVTTELMQLAYYCYPLKVDLIESLNATIQLLDELKHPYSFIETEEMRIILNGVDISQNLSYKKNQLKILLDEAQVAWKNQSYFVFGEQIGEILYELLIKKASYQNRLSKKEEMVLEISAGIMTGFAKDGGYSLKDFKECFNVTYYYEQKRLSHNMTHTNESFYYYASGQLLLTSQSPDNVNEAIQLWGKAASYLPFNMQYCKAQWNETKTLIQELKWAAYQMSHPFSLVYKVGSYMFLNMVKIHHYIKSAVENFENENYFAFGEDIGEALYTLLVKNDKKKMEKKDEKRKKKMAHETQEEKEKEEKKKEEKDERKLDHLEKLEKFEEARKKRKEERKEERVEKKEQREANEEKKKQEKEEKKQEKEEKKENRKEHREQDKEDREDKKQQEKEQKEQKKKEEKENKQQEKENKEQKKEDEKKEKKEEENQKKEEKEEQKKDQKEEKKEKKEEKKENHKVRI